MKNTKKILAICTLALTLILPSQIFAEDTTNTTTDPSVLSQLEKDRLIQDVGLNEEQVSEMPIDVLRELLARDGKVVGVAPKQGFDIPGEGPTPGGIGPMSLTASDIWLGGLAATVTSDKPGYKQIMFYAAYEWNIDPINKYTDKMSIGWPVTNLFHLPVDGAGKIIGHAARECQKKRSFDTWVCTDASNPSNWDNGTGVAQKFDLTLSNSYFKGSITQYAYTPDTNSGTSNVKIVYGHAKTSIIPSVGIYPPGLSVQPGITVDTLDYAMTLSW